MIAAALGLLLLADGGALPAGPVQTAATASVPASDPAWASIGVLCSAGLTGEPCPETRPLSRARVVAMIEAVRTHLLADDLPLPPALANAFAALRAEFATDLLEDDALVPARRVSLEGHAASKARTPITDLGNGTQVGEERGALGFAPTGDAARLLVTGDARLPLGFAALSATLDARAHDAVTSTGVEAPPALRAADSFSLALPQLSLDLEAAGVRATVGRFGMSSGSGARGNLLLDDAGPPVDAALLTLARPWHGLSFELNAIRLEDALRHPFVFEQRVSFSPGPWATFAAQRGIVCCEIGADAHLSDIPTIFIASRENIPGDRLDFDQAASMSASLALPFAWSQHLPGPLAGAGARAWYEYGGTDLYGPDDVKRRGGFPHLLVASSIFGGELVAGRLTLLGEQAMIGKQTVDFYANNRYPHDWSWQGFPLAAPIGGRGLETLVQATLAVGSHGREIGARWLDERYNRQTAAASHRTRAGLTATVPIASRGVRLSLAAQAVDESVPGVARQRRVEADAALSLLR